MYEYEPTPVCPSRQRRRRAAGLTKSLPTESLHFYILLSFGRSAIGGESYCSYAFIMSSAILPRSETFRQSGGVAHVVGARRGDDVGYKTSWGFIDSLLHRLPRPLFHNISKINLKWFLNLLVVIVPSLGKQSNLMIPLVDIAGCLWSYYQKLKGCQFFLCRFLLVAYLETPKPIYAVHLTFMTYLHE